MPNSHYVDPEDARRSILTGMLVGLYPSAKPSDSVHQLKEVSGRGAETRKEWREEWQQILKRRKAELSDTIASRRRWNRFELGLYVIVLVLIFITVWLIIIQSIPYATGTGVAALVVKFLERIILRHSNSLNTEVEKVRRSVLEAENQLGGTYLYDLDLVAKEAKMLLSKCEG